MKRVKPAIPFRSNTAQKPLQPLNTSGPGLRGVSRISRTLSSLRTSPGKQKDLKAKLNALEASNARSHGGGVSERTSASVVGGGGGGACVENDGTNVAVKVGGIGGDGRKGNGSSSSKLEAAKNMNVTSRVSKKQGSAGSGLLRMLSRQESFKAMD
ncbi:hypothetical protein BC829DRAFT_407666 [Chytridium lagenaria]|nr:hypothetical protein BC829DRAFT_407666 [Chytridium lagenaria]